MKDLMRKLCAPLLNRFELGSGAYDYKPLHRKALLFISTVFSLLAVAVIYLAQGRAELAYYFPALVFSVVGVVGLIIGLLGSDRAVAKIWSSSN